MCFSVSFVSLKVMVRLHPYNPHDVLLSSHICPSNGYMLIYAAYTHETAGFGSLPDVHHHMQHSLLVYYSTQEPGYLIRVVWGHMASLKWLLVMVMAVEYDSL